MRGAPRQAMGPMTALGGTREHHPPWPPNGGGRRSGRPAGVTGTIKTTTRRRVFRALLGASLAAAAAGLGYALWWRKNPSACPYGQRYSLDVLHPFVTRRGLREVLAPEPGDRVLEVGPGTGYYSLPVARLIGPGGTLDVLDVQQEMLDHTARRSREEGLSNVVPTLGDAGALPYPDGSFDAAYLNFVLGEVPDQDGALRELRRVLKPGGSLVVGEALPDPHVVPFGRLKERAEAAGLAFGGRRGWGLGYLARFSVPGDDPGDGGKP